MVKVNFMIGLGNFSKFYFPFLKMDESGFEFLSNILGDVNTMIFSNFQKKYKSIDKANELEFFLCAQSVTDEIFPKNLKKHALAEAHKQVAFFLNGFLQNGAQDTELKPEVWTESDDIAAEEKTVPRIETDKKTIEASPLPFTKGVKNFSQKFLPKSKLENEALKSLAFHIHAFCKMVAARASTTAGKKEELQPDDLKNVLTEFLGKNVLKLVLGDGNRCLALYKNGLIEFKPKTKSELGSKKIKDRKIILKPRQPKKPTTTKTPKKVKNGKSITGSKRSTKRKIKPYLGTKRPRKSTTKPNKRKPGKRTKDSKPSKKLKTKTPKITKHSKKTKPLPGPKKRKHSKTPPGSKTIKKRKIKPASATKRPRTTKPRKRKPSKSLTFPKLPKKRKIKPKIPRSPTKPKKRKPTKDPFGSKPSKQRKTKSDPKPKPRTKKTVESKKIAQDVTSNVVNACFRERIVLEKETSNELSRILESVSDALIDICVSQVGDSKEITSEDTRAALLELFPLELSVHALSVASAAIFKYANKI